MWELLGNVFKIFSISQIFFQNFVFILVERKCGEFGKGLEYGQMQRSIGKQDLLKEVNK